MPHQMSSYNAMLAETLISQAGFAVTLGRGVATTANVFVAIDIVEYPTEDTDVGLTFTWEGCDFLVKPQDYVISSAVVEPARGDTISFTDEFSDAQVWQVNFIPGEQVFSREPWRHLMRIHTKRV